MAFFLNLLTHTFCYIFFIIISLYFLSSVPITNSLSTVSISETSNHTLICALQYTNQQGQSHLNCTSDIGIPVNTSMSFSEIVGGNGFLCALGPPSPSSSSSSSSTSVMVCWRFSNSTNAANVTYKRIYRGPVIENIDAGNSHICGLVRGNKGLQCWPRRGFNSSSTITMGRDISSIAVGDDFVCGLSETRNVTCQGDNGRVVGQEPRGKYSVIAAGSSYACAISQDGTLDCWGDTVGEIPQGRFISLALGQNRSCAIRSNGTVTCWGSNDFTMPEKFQGTYFEAIAAKGSVFCGVASSNYSLLCWGTEMLDQNTNVVFDRVLPGPCRTHCPCGPIPGSANFCAYPSVICKPCEAESSAKSAGWNHKMVAFLVVGCVGSISFLLVLFFFLYRHRKSRGCRVHDSGRLDESGTLQNQPEPQPEPRPQPQPQPLPRVLEKRLSHVISLGNGKHLEEFSLQVLLEATNNFSEDKKIGTGSFGAVYHATLEDGKEVAIKRAEISAASPSNVVVMGGTKRQEDKDNAFVNELESLSRLHHKNLVRLLGYYEDTNERILVYEYMTNGSLNDHLHKLHGHPSPLIMSWPGRIKVALDAARGIEYLHRYATPPIIHRDIKSANILLDAKWTAKVSDFGLSLMGPEDEESHLSLLAAGTVGYMDPEYYRLQHLTPKSDVYSFGVVLLEILSGHKAIHKNENGVPRNVVDFVVPFIVQDEIHRVLDPRVPPPTPFEIEAVAFVGYLAGDCVRLEGRDRPTMSEVVNSLERALAACLAKPTLSRSTTDSSD